MAALSIHLPLVAAQRFLTRSIGKSKPSAENGFRFKECPLRTA